MIDQIVQPIILRWPVPRSTAGIDWASTEHAVAVVDPGGIQLERFSVAHTAPGLRQLVARLRRAESPRWRSSGPTARWSTRCSRRVWGCS